jgi:cell division protein ZapA
MVKRRECRNKRPTEQGEMMTAKKSKVTVEIGGENYVIKGDAEPERIIQVANLLDQRMRVISQANPRLSAEKVAVLAALNIANEYMRLDHDYKQLVKMVKEDK